MAISLPIGATNSGTNDWADVHGEDQAIVDYLDGGVPDSGLDSPNNSTYKTLLTVGSTFFGAKTTGTYHFSENGTATANTAGATNAVTLRGLIYFDDADYTVGSLTQKLRIRQQVAVGSTSPSTVTLNCGLYPVTIASGSWTLGTVVSGSTTTTTGLATNTISSFVTSDFTIPSDGAYALGVVVGSVTCPGGIQVSAQLQTRNV